MCCVPARLSNIFYLFDPIYLHVSPSESGHVCVRLARREGAVLELQLGATLHDAPHHACADLVYTPHTTLISELYEA